MLQQAAALLQSGSEDCEIKGMFPHSTQLRHELHQLAHTEAQPHTTTLPDGVHKKDRADRVWKSSRCGSRTPSKAVTPFFARFHECLVMCLAPTGHLSHLELSPTSNRVDADARSAKRSPMRHSGKIVSCDQATAYASTSTVAATRSTEIENIFT